MSTIFNGKNTEVFGPHSNRLYGKTLNQTGPSSWRVRINYIKRPGRPVQSVEKDCERPWIVIKDPCIDRDDAWTKADVYIRNWLDQRSRHGRRKRRASRAPLSRIQKRASPFRENMGVLSSMITTVSLRHVCVCVHHISLTTPHLTLHIHSV